MKRFIENNNIEEYDLIIIGGGITGAAVAYDASSRGLSVALLEKGDFGNATSSATSKMIHGGLRYLATMEFGLVRESLKERKTFENIAPNFVYPLPTMLTNNNQKITNTKFVIKIGMIIYDLLSFDKGRTWDKSKRLPRHKTYSSKKVLQLEPNVKKEGLTGASVYYDCMSIFPERLTLAFIKSAVKCGAQASNYSMVTGFIKNNSTISGVCVKDLLNNKTVEIKGKLVINCGGPWADIILGIANENKTGKEIRRSEGIHIITKKIVNNHSVTCLTPEGRHLFLCPWRGHTLIGTTDREYIGSPDEFRVTKNRIMELLDDLNEVFGNNDSEKIKYNDIVHTYGGLRPLVEDQTEDLYNSSRKYEIYDNSKDGLEGLVTVEGGKYTTSRNLAEHVVSLVFKKLKMKSTKCITAKKHLAGSEINDMEKFVEKIIHENSDFEQSTLEYLARNYGTEYKSVLDIARKDKALCEIMNADGEIMAQVAYGIRNEMAKKLTDIIFRRTGIGTLGHPGGNLNKAADLAAKELNWSKSRLEQEIGEANNRLALPE